jgi:hypothetical protein
VLLKAKLNFTLLPGASGGMARAKGAASKRDFRTACTTGPYAAARVPDEDEGESVEVRLAWDPWTPLSGRARVACCAALSCRVLCRPVLSIRTIEDRTLSHTSGTPTLHTDHGQTTALGGRFVVSHLIPHTTNAQAGGSLALL